MIEILQIAFTEFAWQSSFFQRISLVGSKVFASRWSLISLVIISTLIGAMTLFAYAPAMGADGLDYFLHAAYLAGRDVPHEFTVHPQLVPVLISVSFFSLGEIYLLIGIQIVLGILLPILFYLGIRTVSPFLGYSVALIIALDTQIRVNFNLVATEPFYIFLTALSFYLLLIQVSKKELHWLNKGDILLGLVLSLLIFTRSVGRLIILPFLLAFFLSTRQWKRSLILLFTNILVLLSISTAYRLVFYNAEPVGGTNSDIQIAVPLFRSGLLNSADGPASAEIVAVYTKCSDDINEIPIECMIREIGSSPQALQLFSRGLRELISKHPIDYGMQVLREMTEFFQLSGHQYDLSLAQAQCTDVELLADTDLQYYLADIWLLPEDTITDQIAFRELIYEIRTQMCPPLPENTSVRATISWISERYKSISRPDPWTWYILLAISLVVIPWSRRYFSLASSTFLILFYHAGISAIIFNVQPRYVVVTNPYKVILLVLTIFIFVRLIMRIIDSTIMYTVRKSCFSDKRDY